MAGWTTPLNLLNEELTQRADEGCVIPAALRQKIAELHPEKDTWNYAAVEPLYDALVQLAEDPVLAEREPNELAAIRALRPAGPRDLHWKPDASELHDRLHGAWTGRATGCALGKPVEGMGMGLRQGISCGRGDIKRYLEQRGDWPLRDFFSGRDVGDGMKICCEPSMRENIAYMEPDDDIHYSLIGLGVIEQYGPDFKWYDIARYWLAHLPYEAICTAETQAILNYMNRSARCWFPGGLGVATPSFTRRHRNPYREWIGAQIRADGWAFCCAGKPELAAEFAYRDASWTHERNGIYGEMLFAAIQAAAFVEADPLRLVEIGLSEIPQDCRLAVDVRWLVERLPGCKDWESCMDLVDARYLKMSGVHTINNALICIMALFYGRMDTVESTTISVMAGLDTDCNGATVGSIVGASAGKSRFKNDLAGRLNDTIKPNLIDFQVVTMTELAHRTARQWHRVSEYHGSR
jgi:ADP-ribosylglycohydrolase